MMQTCIGENHPRAAYPVDQINPNQRWRKTVSAFSLPKFRKAVILCDAHLSFRISVSKRNVPFSRTGFMACLSFIHEQPKERQKATESR